ncbi:MAG: hypothetical protein MJE63_12600 [Proteobacteria bacterium]|nr:hypothetical protein [Pseudomonadota bacterium]
MTNATEMALRKSLLDRIQQYDELISAYQKDDRPKSREYLEKFNTDDLVEWLNTRMTQYQFQVDNDINESSGGCEN